MAILPIQLARVSNLLRTNVATQQLTRTQSQLLGVENQLSTGKRLNSPSDDPGAAAVSQQLRKTLEQRLAYADNLKEAGNQLSEVDSSLGDLGDLLKQAQQIASANVGSDVTADERKAAAQIVQSIYNQAISLGNKQFNGTFLFAGDRSTDAPFVETGGGVKFVGSARLLKNDYDENTKLAFQVDGDNVFGAISSRVKGDVDLSPSITASTRLIDLNGATGGGFGSLTAGGLHLASIQISDGTTTKIVDLSKADTIGDVITTINAAGIGAVSASIAPSGNALRLSAGAGDNLAVTEVGGGSAAAALGIVNPGGAGVGNPINGTSLQPLVTPLTPLSDLRNGAGLDLSGLQITNGLLSATVDFTGATTVEDLLNRINSSGTAVQAEINATGTGINILNPTQGTLLTIAENGGTTAADLGVRSFSAATPLSELNNSKGVKTVTGNDVELADSLGVTFQVDLSNLSTVQDVLNAINIAATGAGAGVTASFATTGNGIVLTDSAGGAGTLTVTPINFSTAAKDLGLTGAVSGNVLSGADVNAVAATGIFSNLGALRDALQNNDQRAITAAAEGLDVDAKRLIQVRGDTGARVQELESRQERLDDQNVAAKSLLSSFEDTDYTDAIARFTTLQTALQASLQTAQKVLNLSLMDFLG